MTQRMRMADPVQAQRRLDERASQRVGQATRSDSVLRRPKVDDGHKESHWQH